MTLWTQKKFKDFVKLQRGFDLPKDTRLNGEFPVIASTSINGYHSEYKVKAPCVTTGRSGALGEVLFINENCWPLNTTLWVKDFKGNDPKFVYYKLKTLNLEKFNSGAGVPTLNRNHLDQFRINVPSLTADQENISSVISLYDELIEKNEKRIKILEEMVQRLYTEWFVKFNIPGYEEVKVIESGTEFGKIPEKWEIHKVEDLVKRVPVGKKYENKNVFETGKVPVLDQGKSGFIGFHNDEPGVKASIGNPVIVFANHTCYQNIIVYPFSAIQNVLPFISVDDRDIFWLHWATKDLIKFNDYKGHWPEFMSKKTIVPPVELTKKFGNIAKEYVEMKYKLNIINVNLSKIRDLLIPQLVTGKKQLKNYEN